MCAVLLLGDLQEGFLGIYRRDLRAALPTSFSMDIKEASLGGQGQGLWAGGQAGQMEGAEHPSQSGLCCCSNIFISFANTSYKGY